VYVPKVPYIQIFLQPAMFLLYNVLMYVCAHSISNYLYRISSCKYSRIGCPWRGPNHEIPEHETHCAHPHRTGADVMEALREIDARTLEERRLYDNVFDLLSYEKITFNGLYQLLSIIITLGRHIKIICRLLESKCMPYDLFPSSNGNYNCINSFLSR